MKTRYRLSLLTVVLLVASHNFSRAEDSEYKIVNKYVLGGDGGWDYVTVDSDARRVYIARATRVMVVDADSGKLNTEIGDMQGVHGVALAPELNRGFVSSGRDSTVRVIDLKTLKETSKIPTGKKPDAILYDAPSKKVFAFCGQSKNATVIDAENAKAVGEIDLGGAPEFGVSDGKGHVYVNLEDKSEVVAIDVPTLKATAHWSLAPGAAPTGLAIDVEHHRLFSGCGESKTMVVLDSDSGKIIASLPIGDHCDATAFDPKTQNAFSSNGDGTLTIVHEESPDSFKVIQNLKTQSGARTMGLDTKKGEIWLVTAEMKDRVATPNTFTAIVVGH
jgi:YVTN family beta-propeller protein